jgi:DNA polymerase
VLREPDAKRKVRDLMIDVVDGWLRIRLPSGRYLCYPDACEDEHDKIAYSGVNQYTRKWETLETYGGKLVENIVQATARDVLAHGMALAEKAGYEICLHVHDELITETPDDPAYSAEGLSALMAKGPGWSLGLPLAAAGFECNRYRKD